MSKGDRKPTSPAAGNAAGPMKGELLGERVYRELRVMIATDRFKPGQRLNVEELARELGVSRTPVWQAVRGFMQEGILRNIPNRGVFMAERPMERVRDVIEVRGSLERLACRLAAKLIDRRTLNRLSFLLKEQLKAIENADVPAYVSADKEFHRLICRAGGNQYLEDLYESIAIFYRVPALLNFLSFLHDLYPIHQQIFTALSVGDAEGADKAVMLHSEIILANFEHQVQKEAERRDLVRRIRESSDTGAPDRKHRRSPSSDG